MVVLIPRDEVEHHPAELLLHGRHGQLEPTDRQQRLLVAVGSGLVEIEMGQGAQRLQMQFLPVRQPVETAGHEMPPPILFQQPALAHGDARRFRHPVIGKLHGPVTLRVVPFLVSVPIHTVEFQQPVLEAIARRDLA